MGESNKKVNENTRKVTKNSNNTIKKSSKNEDTVTIRKTSTNRKSVSISVSDRPEKNRNNDVNINLTVNVAGDEKKKRATTVTKKPINGKNAKVQKKSKEKRSSFWIILLIMALLIAIACAIVIPVVIKNKNAHSHTYSINWLSDADNHWHECTGCGDIKDETAHIYDNACDTSCNICGTTRVTTHVYDNACDTTCNICGATRVTTHVYDNACDTTCNICGATRVTTHVYDNACDTTCNICGATRVTTHVYDNACDTSCNICGTTRVTTHVYDNACDTTCNICGATRVTTHVYDNACDTNCNICGTTRVVTHNFGTTYKNNSTTHWQECSECHLATTTSAHTFADGKCSVCGFVEETQGLLYTFNPATSTEPAYYAVAGIGTATAKHIKFPATYNDGTNGEHPVTSIGLGAFSENHDLLSVDFSHITKMEYMAFADCISLTKINIPAGMTDIGASPFLGCIGVTNITVESGNSKYCVLQNCLVDSETGTIINGFSNSTIPTTGVTKIGEAAFSSLTNITSLNIPANITEIGDLAFSYCGNMTLTVDDDNTVYHTAGNCLIETLTKTLITGFNSSIIPNDNSVTSIGNYAYLFLTSITSIVIPEHITSVGYFAFQGCDLTAVYYGGTETQWSSMTKLLGNEPLTNATRYYYSETQSQELNKNFWHYVDGVATAWPVHTAHTFVDGKCSVCDFVEETQGLLYTFNPATATESAYYEVAGLGTATAKHIKIPATYDDGTNGSYPVKSVGDNAFKATTNTSPELNLLSVTFLDNMETIGFNSFNGCNNITSIKFSNTITKIGGGAFSTCMAVTNITLPNSLKEIGAGAFILVGLTSINIPASVETIGFNPFMWCQNLTSITVDSESTHFKIINDYLVDIANKQIIIGFNYSNIITNSEEVTTIGTYAFASLTGAENLKIPNNITKLDEGAFAYCEDIVSVEIPVELTDIVAYSFSGCSSLTTVYYGGTQSQWGEIKIGSNNSELTDATIYYYSETQPTVAGNFWHYVGGVVTVWPEVTGGE